MYLAIWKVRSIMDKSKSRRIFVRFLLAFVLFIYILSVAVALFGNSNLAILLLAYNTFFSVVLYFLMKMQKRLDDNAKAIQEAQKKQKKKI
jgi:4-hydroxybenzoate polyprenyltransferase